MAKKITAVANKGAFVVNAGSVLEIKGGVVEASNSSNNPAFTVFKGSLILDGVEVNNPNGYREVIMTNGTNSGEVIILKNCVLKGRMYFPANSKIFMENCSVYGRLGCITMKSGYLKVRNSEFWMVGADGKLGDETVGDADWAFYGNGAIFGQACIAVEALGSDYSSNPIPVVDIDKSNTFHVARPNVEGTLTFPVLCINYNGNKVDASNITCEYGYTDNITGHVFNGRTAPTDGFCHWTEDNVKIFNA